MGGYLVINNQLSLGQLVAAEIVLGALIYAFKRFGALLADYYDLKAAEIPLEAVLNLPIDEIKDAIDDHFVPITTIQIKTLSEAEIIATPKNPLLVYSPLPDHCQNFTEELLGFREKKNFELYINNTFCSDENRIALRRHTQLVGRPQWFAGTIYDNLTLNQRQLSNKIIIDQLKNIGLLDKIMRQDNGLNTTIYEWQTIFSELEMIQFMVARALLATPQLLIINRAFDLVDKNIDALISHLLTLENTILFIISQRYDFKSMPNRLVLPA
jgi:ABC-type bacteriocin/lantibiotic exporter with double-glycine peptidase domain